MSTFEEHCKDSTTHRLKAVVCTTAAAYAAKARAKAAAWKSTECEERNAQSQYTSYS